MASNGRWFANRGQILQVVIQALSLFIAGKNAWPDLTASKYLSLGALVFYALVGLVVWSFIWMVQSNKALSLPGAVPHVTGRTASTATNPLDDAPELYVEYGRARQIETLIFENDGRLDVRIVSVGSVLWTEKRDIGLLEHPLPLVRSKHRESVQIFFSDSAGSVTPLDEFLRQKVPNATGSVAITYRDQNGTSFVRDFEVKALADGRVTWNPGPIRLAALTAGGQL